ncbi:MAG: response regulator [Gemmatimonadota bacterium]|nr:MAG: response regulator [Gemmatimonadota bacterium]
MTLQTRGPPDRESVAKGRRASDVLASAPLVCVVDDDEQVQKRLEAAIRTLDIRVEVFPSAEEFLESTQCDQADCLIAEVKLPGISGIELLRRLHDAAADCPVILITNERDTSTAVKAVLLGAFDLIEKPLTNHLILNRVALALHLVP